MKRLKNVSTVLELLRKTELIELVAQTILVRLYTVARSSVFSQILHFWEWIRIVNSTFRSFLESKIDVKSVTQF